MKKIIGLIGLMVFVTLTLNAQFRAGFKFGVSSVNLAPGSIDVAGVNDFQDFKLAVAKANYGVHAGLFAQIKLAGLFIQPEVMFNSNSADFKLSEITGQPFDVVKRENYQYLDIPLLLGFKLGPLQLGAGPVGHVFLNSGSELFDINGYGQKFKEFKYGYQANASLVIGKLYLDVRYEGNSSRFGDHIEFFGNQYAFSKSPSRLIGSIGIAF